MSEHEKYEILISAFIDGEATPDEEILVKEHVAQCASCRMLLESANKLSSLLKRWHDETLSPDLERKLSQNLQNQEEKKMNTKISMIKVSVGISTVIIVLLATTQLYIQGGIQGRGRRNVSGYMTLNAGQMASLNKAEGRIVQPVAQQTVATSPKKQPITIYRLAEKAKGMVPLPRLAKTRMKSATDDISVRFSPGLTTQYEPYYLSSEYEGGLARNSQSMVFGEADKEEIEIYKGGKRFQPYEQFNTEQYDRIYENAFLKVVDNPLSTFSIDVDTASYSNIRRFLNMNQLPPEDSVRIEEMINYFTYDYPQPEGEDPFSITTKAAVCPWNKDHTIVLVGLQGKILAPDKIPPSNLVFLLDVSGSMNDPNKLPLLKNAFSLVVKQLGKDDRVAIVVYAGAAGVVLDSTPGNENMKILNALNQLNAGGSTAGGAGIKLAYEIAARNFIEEGNNRVILATDGDFNIGVSSDGELTRLIEEKRKQGVFLTVLGFGMGNYKDSRMEKLADKGNGNYYYIDTLKEAKKVLVNELGSTLFTIAKDVKLQIEFNPSQVKAYRLIGYENRMLAKEDFNDDAKDAGELGAGHAVTALYEIVPANSQEDFGDVDDLVYQKTQTVQSEDLMTVKFRYKEPKEDTSKLISKVIKSSEVTETPSGDFQYAVSIAEFGLLLRNSKYKGIASYQHVLKSARASKGNDAYGYRAELIDLVEKAQSLDIRSNAGNGGIRFKGQK